MIHGLLVKRMTSRRHRAGNGDRHRPRERLPPSCARTPPTRSGSWHDRGLQRHRLAQRDHLPRLPLREREAGMGAADVDGDELVASSQPRLRQHRRSARVRRRRRVAQHREQFAAHAGGGGGLRRFAADSRSASTSSVPWWRTAAPYRHRAAASGPPPSASGVTWIAAGTLPLAPDMRPSVTSATLKPLSCKHARAAGSACAVRACRWRAAPESGRRR
jgi:hypothetical protein